MKIPRKVYLSIFTTLFILLTCVTTTFAWVGMFTSSSFGSFDLNLKVQDPKDVEYYLQISPTGDLNSFDEAVNLTDIQTQIMSNMGIEYASENETDKYSLYYSTYSDYIDAKFSRYTELTPVTPGYNDANDYIDLSEFYEFSNLNKASRKLTLSKKYFKFDLYLSVDTPSGIQNMTNIDASVFFDNITTAIEGKVCGGNLITYNPFTTINDSNYSILTNLNNYVKTNSKNATRIAFEVYNPIDINTSYANSDKPAKTIIYQGGTQLPTAESDIYNFGGIIPEKYNIALKEINTMFNTNIDIDNKDSNNNYYLYKSAKYRYQNYLYKYSDPDDPRYNKYLDAEMTLENRIIWDSNDSSTYYLGIKNGVRTKMKITCYFWFEGWDADCLRFIDRQNVDLKIVFSTDRQV